MDLTYIEVKLLQLEKHLSPKLVTDEGMVIEVRLVQPEKQKTPKLVTDSGILTETKLLHYWYLLLVDYQYCTL